MLTFIQSPDDVIAVMIEYKVTSPELMDEARQNSFNDALYKYGWHDLRAWRYTINGENKLLNHSQHLSNHHHHLHLQGYNPTIIDRNE